MQFSKTPASGAPAPRAPRKRVLILEDDGDLRRILDLALRSRYDVTFVQRGDRVLEEARRARPHVAVLDIHVPGINGFEACEQLRGQADTRGIPVIFLTSRQDEWSHARGKASGADGFVTKPFDVPQLIEKIDALAV